MARQKYYDFTKIFGEEIERLLVQLKGLITSKKITDNLPDNSKKEIKMINDKIDDIIDTKTSSKVIRFVRKLVSPRNTGNK